MLVACGGHDVFDDGAGGEGPFLLGVRDGRRIVGQVGVAGIIITVLETVSEGARIELEVSYF